MIIDQAYEIETSKRRAQVAKKEAIKSIFLSAFSFQLSAAVPLGPEMGDSEGAALNQQPYRPLKIAFAGGGTGGHLFPGIAIAQEFVARNSETRIIFIGTGSPLERSILSKTDFELRTIRATGIKGRGIWNQLISITKIPAGILGAMRILKNFSADLTIGLGGYSAGPAVIGAWLLRIPIAVHEQNVLPGITNRILSRFSNRVYISFENTKSFKESRKIRWTGNPVRQEILTCLSGLDGTNTEESDKRRFTVLIIGGSQGAHRINTAVADALEHLRQKESLYFVHQTGSADEQMVGEAYRQNGIDGKVQSFFDNMAAQYRLADLVICRAGATTVAEITALGKAAVFIPFPHAADNHQMLNAADLSNEGAAEIIVEENLSGKILSDKINYYADHPAVLKDMASRASSFGNPNAAGNIVDDCYRLVAA
jgi:UDP-N-acetylglucosamine--N-acetylmuramyl-(pentapeptide) pyrophosphoryl-undecaprenol N-acetylglucosamine transferase